MRIAVNISVLFGIAISKSNVRNSLRKKRIITSTPADKISPVSFGDSPLQFPPSPLLPTMSLFSPLHHLYLSVLADPEREQ